MARTQHLMLGGLAAALMSLAAPAMAAPNGLVAHVPAAANQTTLVRGSHRGGGWGHHGGGGWGRHGGWGYGGGWGRGGYRHHRGYPYFAYGAVYPYFNDYYDDDYGYAYSDDACYYSRKLRARVCPEY